MMRNKFFKVRWPRKNANLKNFRHLKLWQSTIWSVATWTQTKQCWVKLEQNHVVKLKAAFLTALKMMDRKMIKKKNNKRERACMNSINGVTFPDHLFWETIYWNMNTELNLQKESAAEDITCWVMQTLNCFHSQSLRGGKFALCENIVKKT